MNFLTKSAILASLVMSVTAEAGTSAYKRANSGACVTKKGKVMRKHTLLSNDGKRCYKSQKNLEKYNAKNPVEIAAEPEPEVVNEE